MANIPAAQPGQPPATAPQINGRRPRVMAVDDQRDALRLLQVRLQNAGFECLPFHDGAGALAALATENVDIIILDVMMPLMDGFELCRRIKATERTRDIPVIFLTAKPQTEDKVKGLEVGGHDYLTKPVEQSELLARTRSALRVKQLQDELKDRILVQEHLNQLRQKMLGDHWQKTLGLIASSLAHEINNPLAAALGSVQLLTMEPDLDGAVRERLQVIDHSLQRAGQKLRSLLLIAQSSQSKSLVSLSDLLNDLLALVNFQTLLNNVTITANLDRSCLWLGMANELTRALLYILNNAFEAVAGRPRATISITLRATPADSEIAIQDNGPGIAPDVRELLFHSFFTTKGAPHNGIGLFLANQIIKAGGGSIAINSAEGLPGATVVVHLQKPAPAVPS